jgi:hypothetical protein
LYSVLTTAKSCLNGINDLIVDANANDLISPILIQKLFFLRFFYLIWSDLAAAVVSWS